MSLLRGYLWRKSPTTQTDRVWLTEGQDIRIRFSINNSKNPLHKDSFRQNFHSHLSFSGHNSLFKDSLAFFKAPYGLSLFMTTKKTGFDSSRSQKCNFFLFFLKTSLEFYFHFFTKTSPGQFIFSISLQRLRNSWSIGSSSFLQT